MRVRHSFDTVNLIKKKAKLNDYAANKMGERPLKFLSHHHPDPKVRISPCCCRRLVVLGDGVIGTADVTVIAVDEREKRDGG